MGIVKTDSDGTVRGVVTVMSRCAASSLLWLLTLLATSNGALDKPDISWGDWIIIEDSAPADSGASILLRRITPKSVFVAPNFNTCPEGYRQDALGRCVKLVQVNKQAQWNFFLEKLNSMYAPTPNPVGKESGPLHINLPIGGSPTEEQPTSLQTTPVTTTLQDTDLPSTIEDLLTTIKVDRDTTKIEQEINSANVDQQLTELDQETTTKSEQESTTKFTEEVTNGTTIFEEEASTVKTDQDSSVNMKGFEANLPQFKKTQTDELPQKEIEEDASEMVKRPFIIVVTGQTNLTESTTTTPESVIDQESETVTAEPIKVKLPNSVKTKCDLSVQVSHLKDVLASRIDCEPLPPPLSLEPEFQVRFPSESNVPVRKTSGFIRFPEDARLPFRWPLSWEYQKHPDIMAWPTSSIRHTQSWSNSPPWHRRIIQRN